MSAGLSADTVPVVHYPVQFLACHQVNAERRSLFSFFSGARNPDAKQAFPQGSFNISVLGPISQNATKAAFVCCRMSS